MRRFAIPLAALVLSLASPNAFAQHYEYEGRPASESIDRTGKDFNYESSYRTRITTSVDRIRTIQEWVTERHQVVVCKVTPPGAPKDCHMEWVTERYLKTIRIREFYRHVSRSFRIEVIGSQLLKLERESFRVTFDGIADSLDASSDFNHYEVDRDDRGGEVVYRLHATRKQARPVNSLSVQPFNRNGEMGVMLTDLGFDSELASQLGEPWATVEVWESRPFWFPRKVGTKEVRLPAGAEPFEFATGLRPTAGRNGYVHVKIRRLNSSFHSDKASEGRDSAKLKF